MSTKITPTTIFLGLAAGWTVFWSAERMYLYSFPTPETMVNATVPNYMPSDAPDDWKAALAGGMSLMYAVDREFMSRVVHVQLSGVMAICCVINLYLGDAVAKLSAKERLTSMKASIHRFTGRIFQSCVIPWSLYLNYTLFVYGMMDFGPIIDVADKIASVVSTLAFGAGLCFIIHSKNVKAHKFCMVVGSAALFVIPVQRLYWFLVFNVMINSVATLNGNLMNYFKVLDGTMIFAMLTVSTLGYVYAKENYDDVKLSKKIGGTKLA